MEKNGPNFCQLVTPSQINNNGSALNPDQNGHNPVLLLINGEKMGPIFVTLSLLPKSTAMDKP